MSGTNKGSTPRAIVDDVLSTRMTKEIWTGNYEKVLPVTVQDFDLTAVLPAIFYMFRFGYRRGKGKFSETFGGKSGTNKGKKQVATIDDVTEILSSKTDSIIGFDDDTKKAILGDMLLAFCLENANRALGRSEQVQRVAPAHYMASWIDLPAAVANLRFVPEMIVSMLADQDGDFVKQNSEDDKTFFAVGRGFEKNVLLSVFLKGVVRSDGEISSRGGELSSLTSDHFDENVSVGIDQLLMIRLAQQIGQAPDRIRGGGERGSNQRPIAERAGRQFSEDLRRFVKAYASVIPRHTFVELLESCMAVGLTTILTSSIELLFEWVDTGAIRKKSDQEPTSLFVDCSNGVNRQLRSIAEQSMDDFIRRIDRFPVILMALRLLDHEARYDKSLKKPEVTMPYATDWINLLGDLLKGRLDESRDVMRDMERHAQKLAEALEEDNEPAAEILKNDIAEPNPVWRIAESLTFLQGRKNTQNNVLSLIDSTLLINRPHGFASKRSVLRVVGGGGKNKRDVRSLVFTDAVLDQLVHLLVLPNGNRKGYRPLSFSEFLQKLRKRYGFCIDEAPPGLTISNAQLQENRSVLERRLRDLGLLVGVNDAEAMKQLKPRFDIPEGNDHDMV
jgi:hypothetical protein